MHVYGFTQITSYLFVVSSWAHLLPTQISPISTPSTLSEPSPLLLSPPPLPHQYSLHPVRTLLFLFLSSPLTLTFPPTSLSCTPPPPSPSPPHPPTSFSHPSSSHWCSNQCHSRLPDTCRGRHLVCTRERGQERTDHWVQSGAALPRTANPVEASDSDKAVCDHHLQGAAGWEDIPSPSQGLQCCWGRSLL